MTDWRAKYEKRIASAQWRNMRRDFGKLRGERCEHCRRATKPLFLHHKTYERLGSERPDDLELLCKSCHDVADRERALRGKVRSAKALEKAHHEAALNTYATKKYDEDWRDRNDCDDIEQEFGDWLDRQSE